MIRKFFQKAEPETGIIALDIGTDMTKAVLFTIEEKRNISGELISRRAVIKGSGKIKQNLIQSGKSNITDIAKIIHSAKEAIQTASLEAKINPQKLVLGIGGELVKGATSTLVHKREDSESKINVTELRNIIHKLQWKAFGDVRKKLSDETGYPEIDIKLVSSSIIEVRIDGYKVTNLLGFQGKEVKMSLFNSFAPLGHFEALQTIANELELEVLGITSEPFALSRCLQFEEKDLSAIFIDVGGFGTDIAILINNSVINTKMFGIGGNTFTKRLSVELNISFEEAEELKRAYTKEKLEQKSKKIISRIVDEDLEVWLEGVVLSLSENKMNPLPHKIFLSGGGTYLPEIQKALNNRKWHKKLPFSHPPQAHFLTPKNLRQIIDETKKIQGREDIMPLALVNLGIDLSSEETLAQKLLRKVIGIMQV